jgi:imidazolonepropionase-like amidohydrolase
MWRPFLALLALSTPLAAEPIRYEVILGGNPAGFQTIERAGGEIRAHYEFNDRGRGPKLDAVYRLDARRWLWTLRTQGSDYFHRPVAESFSQSGLRTTWKNAAEQVDSGPRGFYVAFDGAPVEQALLAVAALEAGGDLPLLPSGAARARVAARRPGPEGIGELRLVEIDGLGFAPQPVWIDAGGELFALVDSWMSVVRAGQAAMIPDLLAEQQRLAAERAARLARDLAERPGVLWVRHARLFDPDTRTVRPDAAILVENGKITAVGDEAVVAPPEARLLDAQGRTLLPGLWDMHVHLGETDGLAHLAAGVTTVRDLANDMDFVLGLQRSWDRGEALGPRVLLAGILDGPGPYAGPTKVLVDTPEAARAAIDRYAAAGYVQIKIYSSIRPELVPGIVEYAHGKGLRVSGHVPAFMTAEQAVRDGFDEIQHVNFLLLNFLFDRVQDTRTPARFTAVAEHAAELDVNSPAVAKFFDLLVERRTVLDPTLGIFEQLFTARPGDTMPGYERVAPRLPPQVARGLLAGGLEVPKGQDARYRAALATAKAFVRQAWRRGLRIVAGTDGMAGFGLERELELYVDAGIPAPEVLALATLGAARVMHRDGELGTIAPGKLADFILVDGAPDLRISDIRRVRTVVRGGVLLDAGELWKALGVRP